MKIRTLGIAITVAALATFSLSLGTAQARAAGKVRDSMIVSTGWPRSNSGLRADVNPRASSPHTRQTAQSIGRVRFVRSERSHAGTDRAARTTRRIFRAWPRLSIRASGSRRPLHAGSRAGPSTARPYPSSHPSSPPAQVPSSGKPASSRRWVDRPVDEQPEPVAHPLPRSDRPSTTHELGFR